MGLIGFSSSGWMWFRSDTTESAVSTLFLVKFQEVSRRNVASKVKVCTIIKRQFALPLGMMGEISPRNSSIMRDISVCSFEALVGSPAIDTRR